VNGCFGVVGSVFREAGVQLEQFGRSLQGNKAHKEFLSRHRRIMEVLGKKPVISDKVWIAPNASVMGQVHIGEKSSIWYGAVIRGDVNKIRIGEMSSIGDRCVVHVSSGTLGEARPTFLGDKVVVEHGAILHACTIQDGVRIGPGAVIMDGVTVEKGSMVAAGSVVLEKKTIRTGELWSGSPAKFERALTQEEKDEIALRAERVYALAQNHIEEHKKTALELDDEEYMRNHYVESPWGDGEGTRVQPQELIQDKKELDALEKKLRDQLEKH